MASAVSTASETASVPARFYDQMNARLSECATVSVYFNTNRVGAE